MFQADSGTKSNCSGACATNWPPLTSSNPTVGKGANASMVGTSKRSDGKTQVTYNGHRYTRSRATAARATRAARA